MKLEWLLSLSLSATLLTPTPLQCWAARDFNKRTTTLAARDIIDETNLSDAYDYVIAGGGLAGLVLAARLSEKNDNITVLVVEAGLSGDEVADRISACVYVVSYCLTYWIFCSDTPSGAFYESIVGSEYDWGHVTVPQSNLNNRTISWPRGKVSERFEPNFFSSPNSNTYSNFKCFFFFPFLRS